MTLGFGVDTDVLHQAATSLRSIMNDLNEASSGALLAGRGQYGDASVITAAGDFSSRYAYAAGVMATVVGAHADDLDASSFSYGEVDGNAACVFRPEP